MSTISAIKTMITKQANWLTSAINEATQHLALLKLPPTIENESKLNKQYAKLLERTEKAKAVELKVSNHLKNIQHDTARYKASKLELNRHLQEHELRQLLAKADKTLQAISTSLRELNPERPSEMSQIAVAAEVRIEDSMTSTVRTATCPVVRDIEPPCPPPASPSVSTHMLVLDSSFDSKSIIKENVENSLAVISEHNVVSPTKVSQQYPPARPISANNHVVSSMPTSANAPTSANTPTPANTINAPVVSSPNEPISANANQRATVDQIDKQSQQAPHQRFNSNFRSSRSNLEDSDNNYEPYHRLDRSRQTCVASEQAQHTEVLQAVIRSMQTQEALLDKLSSKMMGFSDEIQKLRNHQQTYKVETSPPINSNLSETSSSRPSSEFVKLPQLDLPKFNGDPRKFEAFFEVFSLAVDSNPSLSAEQKLLTLKTLLIDDAAILLDGLPVNARNYTVALDLLTARYQNSINMTRGVSQTLSEIPTANFISRSLYLTYDKVQAFLNRSTALGISQDNPCVFDIISGKFPDAIRRELRKRERQEKSTWSVPTLMVKLLDVITELEPEMTSSNAYSAQAHSSPASQNCNSQLSHKQNSAQSIEPPIAPTPKLSFAQSLQERNPPDFRLCKTEKRFWECYFCGHPDHTSKLCQVIPPIAKNVLLCRDSKCLICFRNGHPAEKCRRKEKCIHCDGLHHTSVCTQTPLQEAPTQNAQQYQQFFQKPQFFRGSQQAPQNLATLTITSTNSNDDRQASSVKPPVLLQDVVTACRCSKSSPSQPNIAQ